MRRHRKVEPINMLYDRHMVHIDTDIATLEFVDNTVIKAALIIGISRRKNWGAAADG